MYWLHMISVNSPMRGPDVGGSPVNLGNELNGRFGVTGCHKLEKHCSGMVPGGTLIPARRWT